MRRTLMPCTSVHITAPPLPTIPLVLMCLLSMIEQRHVFASSDAASASVAGAAGAAAGNDDDDSVDDSMDEEMNDG